MQVKKLVKHIFLFMFGGGLYLFIELLARGHTHWSMFILGGACFVALGLINEVLPWTVPLLAQSLLGGVVITLLEFMTGCLVNRILHWNVWDYSMLPHNILGQISPQFSLLWCILAVVGIVLDDYIRWFCFNEEEPHYKII